jgi:hypothetical protein
VAELEPATVVSRPPEVVFEQLDDEVLVLHPETGKYVSLNATGAQLWAMLEAPATVQGLVDHLVATRRVDADRAGADVRTFLTGLVERGLVTAGPPGSPPAM